MIQINNIRFLPTCGLNAVFQSYAHTPSIAPDDDVFRHLSLVYSNNHAKMSRGVSCKSGSPRFEKGITNGAAWYPLTGIIFGVIFQCSYTVFFFNNVYS